MKYLLNFVFIALLFSIAVVFASAPSTILREQERQVSLDHLLTRVEQYWKLLSARKVVQAGEYVSRTLREDFLARGIPRFSDPHISALDLTGDPTEVTVTVLVERALPPPLGVMKWPVKQRWVFEEDDWYVHPTAPLMPVQNNAGTHGPSNTGQLDKQEQDLHRILRFEQKAFDFGTVRQGDYAPIILKYTLEGNESITLTFEKMPLDFRIPGLKQRSLRLMPGKLQELKIEMATRKYDGAVEKDMILVAHQENAEASFEFTVKGFVYVPVSHSPRILRFTKGNLEKEITVRNNTKSALEIVSFLSESKIITAEPIPTTILPGQELRIHVKQIREINGTNLYDNLVFHFAEPIDGMGVLRLTAVMNYQEEEPAKDDPIDHREIQELIKKNTPSIPMP